MTPRVLLICYYFPPLGGAGVGRPLSLFRLLPSHGIQCDVLTVKPVAYRVFEPELLEGLDATCIHRAGSRDPQRLLRLAGIRLVRESHIRRAGWISNRFFPDPRIGWVAPAVRMARQLVQDNNYTAMISTSPPISCHLVAQAIQTETGLPWIADFRDFWISHKIEDVFASRSRRERAWELIGTIKDRAAVVTTCNPAISEYLGGGEVIYNGYDDTLAQHWRVPSDRTVMNIGLLGTFDELVPIEPLLRVLAMLRQSSPELFKNIRLLQVGRVDEGWFRALLRKYALFELCTMHGFQDRRRSIEMLSEASLFYLGLASAKERGIVPSRLFDLFASGRPILTALPSGSVVAELIAEIDNGCPFDSDDSADVRKAADFIGRLARQHLSGEMSLIVRPEYASRFSASAMAARFAEVIRNL
jgi:hypothetical protein